MHFEIGRCLCKCVAIANIIIITNRHSFQLWKCTLRNVYVKMTVAVENSPFHHQAPQQNFTFFPHCCYDHSFSLPYHSKAPPCPHLESTCFAAPHSLHPPPVSADPFHQCHSLTIASVIPWITQPGQRGKGSLFKKNNKTPKGFYRSFQKPNSHYGQSPHWNPHAISYSPTTCSPNTSLIPSPHPSRWPFLDLPWEQPQLGHIQLLNKYLLNDYHVPGTEY